LKIEKKLWQKGIVKIAGIDEVGRGPLAGPVVACSAFFEKDFIIDEVQDSKKLTEKKREAFFDIILNSVKTVGIGSASVQEIDEHNIRQATFMAMNRAVASMKMRPDYLLIDGENLPDCGYPSAGVIKGDSTSFTIGAASIVAKVFRDRYMKELDKQYPIYLFAKNKGYGTAEHIKALKKFGPSPHHRKTFLTKILGEID